MLFESMASVALAIAWASLAESRSSTSPSNTPRISKRWLPCADKVRGVNLGSQFIVEPWMAGDEWKSMGCGDSPDEWTCVERLGQDAADAAFRNHWQNWINADDLKQIKSYGLNTVRIPVGFWLKEDLVNAGEHYPRGGLEYLDYIVGNCTELGLYVIMDLHAGPGSQFPKQQYTGHVVDNAGFYTPENYKRAYKFLEWMTERIHTTPAYSKVGMLHVMNEPLHSDNGYAEAANMIANYYPTAWRRIRAREAKLGVKDSEKLHIQYMDETWGSGDPKKNLPETKFAFYDDHRYYKWDPTIATTQEGYISAVCGDNRGGSDTIVGEWSLAVADEVQYSPEFDISNTTANDE
ncbi:glycoside hydrolase family 5 protein [Xylariaceae sp. FL0594]|nr:glycoside hydrolase family 5 protein [Xylariaceae sp. FL0594]